MMGQREVSDDVEMLHVHGCLAMPGTITACQGLHTAFLQTCLPLSMVVVVKGSRDCFVN